MQKATIDLVSFPNGGALTRRRLMQGLVAVLAPAAMARKVGAAAQATEVAAYSPAVLPPGIRSRFVNNINGLRMHVLEAGFEDKDRPAVLLLHGFPELAYSWRKVMRPIAAAGYHVIAPDVRGYGRTSGTDVGYDDDLAPFRSLNQVRRRRHRPRSGLAARRLVRRRAARRLPVGRHDERAFRRPAGVAVQHRGCGAGRRGERAG